MWQATHSLRYCLHGLSIQIFLEKSFVFYLKTVSIWQRKTGTEIRANHSCFVFLPSKDVLSFHFDSLEQTLNHLKVKDAVDTIQGVPGPWANDIFEFNDTQKIEQINKQTLCKCQKKKIICRWFSQNGNITTER